MADTFGVSALNVAARLGGAAKSAAIAQVFGSGAALDAYLLAFLIPSFASDVFCGSLVPVLVPAFVKTDRATRLGRATSLYAQSQRTCLKYSVAGFLSLAICAGVIAILSERLRLIAGMVAIMSPILPLTALTNVWRAVLNARQRFVAPAASSVAVPLVLVVLVLVAGRALGIWVVAWATTLAIAAEAAVLGAGLRHAGIELFPALTEGQSLKHLSREYVYLAAATALSTASFLITQAMAATLGEGSVSILNYGTRLAAVILSTGPAALGVTVLPRFARLAARRDRAALRQTLFRMLPVCAASSVAAVALAVLSGPIVQLVFEHGAFTPADTLAVTAVQQISLLQIPFAVCSVLLMRTLIALESNRTLLPVSAAVLVVNVCLNIVLRRYAVPGLALAMSLSQALMCLILLWVVFRNHGQRFLPAEVA